MTWFQLYANSLPKKLDDPAVRLRQNQSINPTCSQLRCSHAGYRHRSRGASRHGNAELTGAWSPAWFFGAARLRNQPFDPRNLRHKQQIPCRYHGEPAAQLGISREEHEKGISESSHVACWNLCRNSGVEHSCELLCTGDLLTIEKNWHRGAFPFRTSAGRSHRRRNDVRRLPPMG